MPLSRFGPFGRWMDRCHTGYYDRRPCPRTRNVCPKDTGLHRTSISYFQISQMIILSFIVVFISFEGVELLREIQDEQTFEKLVEKKGFVSKKKKKEEDTIEEVRQQRRRGLGWLAVVTGIAVWATGLVNSLNPL